MDALSEVREIVARSLTARFLSENRELSRYRNKWHSYHVTQVGGVISWYEVLDLRQDAVVGSISAESKLYDLSGAEHVYLNEIGVRGNRLIRLLTRKDASEEAHIAVFPMTRGFERAHTGVSIHETWDSSQILTKVIISKTLLVEGISEGRVDGAHTAVLNGVWRDRFTRTVRIELEC